MPVLLALLPLLVLVLYATRSRAAPAGDQVPDQVLVDQVLGVDQVPDQVPDQVLGQLPESTTMHLWNLGAVDVALAPDAIAFPLAVALRKVFQLPAAGRPYAEAIKVAESRYEIPDSLLARVLYEESRFRPDIISGATRSPKGAAGIAQFMPATAAELALDPLDPAQAINGAARYLRQLFDKFGDWALAVAAYNWGPGNVARKGVEQAPSETRRYVSAILGDVGV